MPEIPQNMATKEHSLQETCTAPFLLCNFYITFELNFKVTQLQIREEGLKKMSSKNNAMHIIHSGFLEH